MQISKVRVGRFYTLALRGGGTEKVLAYGILRELGQPPLVTVKDEAGEIEHVKTRRLTPIEPTPEQAMNALVAFADGGFANSPVDVGSSHVSEFRIRQEYQRLHSKPTVVGFTEDGLPLTAEAVSKTLVKTCDETRPETPAERVARVHAEAMARS